MATRSLVLTTRNERGTREIGRALGVACCGPLCVALRGPLGAGKTVVVKGMAEGLGMADTVTSPTFTFVNEYHGGGRRLTHVDVYRIESYEDLESIGWSDVVLEADVLAVEWAERADGELPAPRIDVTLVLGSGDERLVELRAVGAEAEAALARLQAQGLD
ncbi:MAG: tRNA (adenosine(37)-N6)-threonylcarbamoyltransferase complex ATPase subunit type 1 TsaE, partial [Chloroflexi bacterium]|nr:tRNA (adenosine(37)-N6)-threonylcarbamoyltransferase complex ATPase subunit type 1 TsaE [Chloroflexota bacterium]